MLLQGAGRGGRARRAGGVHRRVGSDGKFRWNCLKLESEIPDSLPETPRNVPKYAEIPPKSCEPDRLTLPKNAQNRPESAKIASNRPDSEESAQYFRESA